MSTKETNPKDAIGSNKVPLHLWPSTATAIGSIALLNGALKYGRSNWRVAGVRASIYADAAKRHLDAWFEGEETDPDDGVDHLGAVLACLAILVDARAAGKLNDDRAVQGGYRKAIDVCTSEVTRLKELHAGKEPKHYTINDSPGSILNELIQTKLGGSKEEYPWLILDKPGIPCASDTPVEISMRDGSSTIGTACNFRWSHTGGIGDIMKWRYV